MTNSQRLLRKSIFPVLALLLLAANLRPALITVGPLVGSIQDATGLSAAAIGLLTSLPILALGVFAPLANFGRRVGLERTLALAMFVLCVGILIRSAGTTAALFAGTLILAAGIAVGNVLVPSLIKRDYPERIGFYTTIYVLCLALTAAIATGFAVPLERLLPGGWRSALAIWAIPAGLAALVWVVNSLKARPSPVGVEQTSKISVWRSPLAWFVAAFLGLQSTSFYVVVSWFPRVIQSIGYDPAVAALLVTGFQLVSVASGAALPKFLALREDQRALAVVSSSTIVAGVLGMLLYPSWTMLWVALAGFGSGVCFPLAIAFIGLRSADHHEAASLSLMAQTMGYTFAAGGPVLFGLAYDLSGGWSVPLLGLVICALLQALTGYKAGQKRTVSEPKPGLSQSLQR